MYHVIIYIIIACATTNILTVIIIVIIIIIIVVDVIVVIIITVYNSFIQAISIAPLPVRYCSEALPTQYVLCRSFVL